MSSPGIIDAVAAAWAATSPAEVAAAALGVVYVVLVIGQHRAGWAAALLSTGLYLHVFYAAGLYMQAALQGFYVLVAVYGWWAWRRVPGRAPLAVSRASWRVQGIGLAAVILATAATATWLARETLSTDPYLDSLTTWASVFTTWLMARKKIENWPWWLVVDALIVVLCWQQKLYASMILYMLYLVLVIVGWRSWYADLTAPAAAEDSA
ncbi:MAG TPA: nicotinamide riboside transporter PnuC [Steroidobacteraceae bacterium]|nr:nicotinamide riboside transporter PnuC [Steroidobacteraceae bacterium]